MAKTDVGSAFHIIPVNPADYYLLGMHWEGLLLCILLLANGTS